MSGRLSFIKINWRGLYVKTLTASAFSLGLVLLTGGIINFVSPRLVFDRAVLFFARMISEDGHVMAATIEELYRQWLKFVFVIPLAGLTGIFFGFMLSKLEKDGQKRLSLIDPGVTPEYASRAPISHIFALIAIVLVAAALRIPNINQSLWVDEISAAGFIENFRMWPYADLANHWLYTFFGFISVKLFGESEITLRMLVFILSVLTVCLAYFTCGDFLTRKQRLLLAAIFCCSGFHILSSVEARGSIMLALCTMLSSYFFLRLISGKFPAAAKRDNLWFGVFTGLGFLSHFYYIWVISAGTLTIFSIFLKEKILAKREDALKSYVLSNLVLAMASGCLVALLIYGPDLFIAVIIKIKTWGNLGGNLGEKVSFKILGTLFTGTPSNLYGIIFTAIAILGALDFRKSQKSLFLYSIFLIIVPLFIVKFTVATISRHFIYMLPILYILLTRGMVFIANIYKAGWMRNAALIAIAVFYICLQLPSIALHYQYRKSGQQDYRAVGRLIDESAKAGDIIFGIGSGAWASQYYIKKHKTVELSEEEFYRQLKVDKTKLWVIVTFPEFIPYVSKSLRLYNAARADLRRVGYFPGKLSDLLVYH